MQELSPYSDFARAGAQAELLALEAASPEAAERLKHSVLGPNAKAEFLQSLQMFGNVRLACKAARVSAQTAYRARRRSGIFAQAWDAALLAARSHAEATLADRAINGVDEPVFYHGEEIARRRRYDPRLLLAHLARLDKLEERAEVASMLPVLDDCIDALRAGVSFEEMAGASVEGTSVEGRVVEPQMEPAEEAPESQADGEEIKPQDRVPSVPSCRTSKGAGRASKRTNRGATTRRDTRTLEERLTAMERARPKSAPPLHEQVAEEAQIGELEALQLAGFEAREPRWWEAVLESPNDAELEELDPDLAQKADSDTLAAPLEEKERDCEKGNQHTEESSGMDRRRDRSNGADGRAVAGSGTRAG